MKLDKAKFIDKDSLSKDSAFNVTVRGVRTDSNGLLGWLKHGPKRSPQ